MTLVVLGIDALDPDLVDSETHPNLTLAEYRSIETISSSAGKPSTHELWPTIITGLRPEDHGLQLEDGVAWENPIFSLGSSVAQFVLPKDLRTRLGAWLLNNTNEDAFRVPATYYEENDIKTMFDNRNASTIGIPNYVTDSNSEDREHQLRRNLGDLFERDPGSESEHRSSDPEQFYNDCLEMSMVRIARVRRALRSKQYELVFGYTSGLDLIGHIAYNDPELQQNAYDELDAFVGELVNDLSKDDELLLVSDHGLQDGLHTDTAMVAGTATRLLESIDSVTDIYETVENELRTHNHTPSTNDDDTKVDAGDGRDVQRQLEDLGYL